MRAAPGKNFQLGHQPGHDVIANQIRQSLLGSEGILNAANIPRLIFHSDKQCTAAVLANATIERRTPFGDDRSRLNSDVLPSGCLSSSSSITTLNLTLKQTSLPYF